MKAICFKTLCGILFILLISEGCFRESKEPNILETFYPDGVLKSKQFFWKDGVFVDTAFYYYQNGQPSLIEVHNDSGILNGKVIFFYENGEVEQTFNYELGLKEGFLYRYSDEGYLKTKNFYVHDRLAGDVFGYNKWGQINYYGFYDFDEKNRNMKKWDSIGKINIDFCPIIFLDTITVYKESQYFDFSLLLSNPPGCRTKVIVDYLSKNGIAIKSDTITNVPYYYHKAKITDSLYEIKFFGSQYDSLNHKEYEQSNTRRIERH